MEETCRRWTNPIVLVVYYYQRNITGVTTNSSEPWMQILDWSLVCPQVKLVPVIVGPHEQDWQYPVNRLRNIGLDALETPLFLMMDMDFLPSENLQQAITQHFFSTYQYYHETKNQRPQQYLLLHSAYITTVSTSGIDRATLLSSSTCCQNGGNVHGTLEAS
jgi:hypothetical protein